MMIKNNYSSIVDGSMNTLDWQYHWKKVLKDVSTHKSRN
jgi:hypothetical protein